MLLHEKPAEFLAGGGRYRDVGGCVSFVGSNLMELASIGSLYVSFFRIGGWRLLLVGKPASRDAAALPPQGEGDYTTPLRGGCELPATNKRTGIIANIVKEVPMKLLEHAAYSYGLHSLDGIAPSL